MAAVDPKVKALVTVIDELTHKFATDFCSLLLAVQQVKDLIEDQEVALRGENGT